MVFETNITQYVFPFYFQAVTATFYYDRGNPGRVFFQKLQSGDTVNILLL